MRTEAGVKPAHHHLPATQPQWHLPSRPPAPHLENGADRTDFTGIWIPQDSTMYSGRSKSSVTSSRPDTDRTGSAQTSQSHDQRYHLPARQQPGCSQGPGLSQRALTYSQRPPRTTEPASCGANTSNPLRAVPGTQQGMRLWGVSV